MKLKIISNKTGEIVATYQPTTGENAPNNIWITSIDGQMGHEVEVPDDLAKPESIIGLHNTHLVEVTDKTAKLVKRKAT